MTPKPKNLDSLNFPETKKLLDRICKSLGFKLFHRQYFFIHKHYWCLAVDNNDDNIVVFLEGHNRDVFRTAKALLAGILNSRIFKLRHVHSFEESIIQNPLYNLELSALQIKLDLFA